MFPKWPNKEMVCSILRSGATSKVNHIRLENENPLNIPFSIVFSVKKTMVKVNAILVMITVCLMGAFSEAA